jgi:hypothetical protein
VPNRKPKKLAAPIPDTKSPEALDLIQRSGQISHLPVLSDKAVEFLADLLKYNDSRNGNRERVGRTKVVRALREKFKVEIGERVFERLMQKHFQRSWSGH